MEILPLVREGDNKMSDDREGKYVNLEVTILGETQKAYKVKLNGQELWLPKSQIRIQSKEADKAFIQATEWIMQAKKLKYDKDNTVEADCPF